MLKDKIVLVTGAGRGIGAAIAENLAELNATVIVNFCHSADAAEIVCQTIKEKGGKAHSVQADLRRYEDIQKMFDWVESTFGPVDVLVNNSGLEIRQPSTDYSEETFDTMLDTNLKGAFFCSQRALRTMKERGWGRIVNISSVHQERATGNRSPYSISKAGMHMMTRELALEFSRFGITVNSVLPGAIRTDMNRKVLEDPAYEAKVLAMIPARYIGEVEDVAHLVRFLVSDQAKYITGTALPVDGGLGL